MGGRAGKAKRILPVALAGAFLGAAVVGFPAFRGPQTSPFGTAVHGKEAMNPRRSNHLAGSTSPYLLQHAHNPVDWYPWGSEALERARKEDKPIFLSIGYSSCHWCHVMAHESFEDEPTARFLNEHFVSIKVDREQRPDLDEIYMTSVQMMTGQGGWPLNVFLMPDLKPFYGGTYWPKESRSGLPSFRRVLESVATAYRERRKGIEETANRLTAALRSQPPPSSDGEVTLDATLLERAVAGWKARFDSAHGGFGGAPKFPPATAIRVLLRHHNRTGDAEVLRMATLTLDRMADGGMYDHLGGGFHRYSVDPKWLVPHFEKMLYDNALLAQAYLEACQVTGKSSYARVATETLDYILRDMTDPEGGFYSTEDADSEGHEGTFYLWTPDQVARVLGTDDGTLFMRYYGVTDGGNFEGTNILSVPKPLEAFAKDEHLDADALRKRLAAMRAKMLNARSRRPRPGRDEKILADWNGLAIAAMARGCQVLGDARYRAAAVRAADFLLTRMRNGEGLLHAHRGGGSHTAAFQHDYAYAVEALIDLYEATFDPRWIREALRLADEMMARFWDEKGGGFYYSEAGQEDVLARLKRAGDTARPSGNSVAAHAALRLARLTGRRTLRQKAEATLKAFAPLAKREPTAMAGYLLALDLHLGPAREIAIVGPAGRADTKALVAAIHATFLPRAVTAWLDPASSEAGITVQTVPLLKDRPLVGGRSAAYVCENFVCRKPVTSAEALTGQLGK